MRTQDTVEAIRVLENSIDVKNPHRMSEISVEMSILLGNVSDDLAELEANYEIGKTAELKSEINTLKRFLKTRESTVKRIEHSLKNKTNLERNGA